MIMVNTIWFTVSILIILIFVYGSVNNNQEFNAYIPLILIILILYILYRLTLLYKADPKDVPDNDIPLTQGPQGLLPLTMQPTQTTSEPNITNNDNTKQKTIKKVRFAEPLKTYEKYYDYVRPNTLPGTDKELETLLDYQNDFFTFRDVNNLLSSENLDPVDKINMYRGGIGDYDKNTKLWDLYDELTRNETVPVYHKNIPIDKEYYPYHGSSRKVRAA